MATEPGDDEAEPDSDPDPEPGPASDPEQGERGPPPGQGRGPEPGPGGVTDDDQTWGVLVHASAFAGLFVPFGNVLGPLLVWLIKKDESRFVDENGREAVNFQLTWSVIMFVALLSLFVAVGLLLVPIVGLAWLALVVIASAKASDGEVYDYPLTIDFLG